MTKRTRKKLVTLAVLLVVGVLALGQEHGWFGSTTQPLVTNQPGLYTVSRFVDGDTIAVDMNGKVETVRMIGIDTPETHRPNTPVQCYGPAASAYTKNLIGSSQVRLESDPQSTNRDRYDRLLRYVYLPDGRLVALELLRGGYAFAYTSFPFTKSAEFSQAQDQAQAAQKGLWGNCVPYQQENGRWQTEGVE
jgi:micrococcal nuclease